MQATCYYLHKDEYASYTTQHRKCEILVPKNLKEGEIFTDPSRKHVQLEVLKVGLRKEASDRLGKYAVTLGVIDSFNEQIIGKTYDINLLELCFYELPNKDCLVAIPYVPYSSPKNDTLFDAFQHFLFAKKNKWIKDCDHVTNGVLRGVNIVVSNTTSSKAFFENHICSELCTSLNLTRHKTQQDYALEKKDEKEANTIAFFKNSSERRIKEVRDAEEQRLLEERAKNQKILDDEYNEQVTRQQIAEKKRQLELCEKKLELINSLIQKIKSSL